LFSFKIRKDEVITKRNDTYNKTVEKAVAFQKHEKDAKEKVVAEKWLQ